MDKARIVIASVLKPLTEPRAFAKLAVSLRETNKYHLNIIGFCSKNLPSLQDIRFTPIFRHHRTHYSRWWVPFRFIRQLFQYKPQLVIVTTYELLPAALLVKFFLGYKLVYDVQENYSRNVLLNRAGSVGFRLVIAYMIRAIERLSHPWMDHYILAERSYQQEFPYIRQYTLLENKYAGFPLSIPFFKEPSHTASFLISGTITPAYGIGEAIQWFLSLQQEMPDLCLKITGHVPLPRFKKQVEEWTRAHPGIKLNISSKPLPYSLLQEELKGADIVLLPYKNLDSIRYKIPAKLYESLAFQKPVLISANPLWQELIQVYPAGLSIDFSRFDRAKIHYHTLRSLPLYRIKPGPEVCWDSEKQKLLRFISDLLE